VAEGEPLKLATLLPLSGKGTSEMGLDVQRGALLAAEQRNNEVAGHPIEWRHEDDDCSVQGGKYRARDLALEQEIVAVIGAGCSLAAVIATQILSEAGIVHISPSSTAPVLTDSATHQPFFLRTAWNDAVQPEAMAKFAVRELGVESAATIFSHPTGKPAMPHVDPFNSEVLAETFAREFSAAGGTITSQLDVTAGQQDLTPLLEEIAASGAEFLYYPVFAPEGARITTQAREMAALDGVHLAGADAMLTEDWLTAAGPSAEGVYLSAPDSGRERAIYKRRVLKAYKQRWVRQPRCFTGTPTTRSTSSSTPSKRWQFAIRRKRSPSSPARHCRTISSQPPTTAAHRAS
jgi:branched-chain amino acid transport system substrate-binding protein